MRVNYMQMAGHDPSVPPDQVWYSSWPHSGVLQGIGSHAIDQCRFLVGEVKSVMARAGTFNPQEQSRARDAKNGLIDEATAAILEFENGAMGVMVATALATGRKNDLAWEINGSEGSLRWNLEHPNSLLACLEGVGDRSLSGFTEISVTDRGTSLHYRMVAVRPYAGLGARPYYRKGSFSWRHSERRRSEPLPCYV